jgi:RNA polymerase sigma factor (TIGR02999 family)
MATLLPLVYKELRAMAADQLKRRPGHTIQPTALVHEAYIKMAGPDKAWASREHFMATAATAMRHVLIDRLRSKSTDKRGGGIKRADFEIESLADDSAGVGGSGSGGGLHGVRVLELDELLTELAKADARAAQAAEMRLFGGMDQESIARVQGVSRTIVSSDWQFTRAWLASRMHDSGNDQRSTSGGNHGQ